VELNDQLVSLQAYEKMVSERPGFDQKAVVDRRNSRKYPIEQTTIVTIPTGMVYEYRFPDIMEKRCLALQPVRKLLIRA
jgi:hypothetical protein